MKDSYKKELYDGNMGFRLHHTTGEFAGKSTTQYLHYDVELSFIYFICGVGEIKIEGKSYTVDNGDLILLKPSELYHFVVKDGTYHERLVLYFNSSLLQNFENLGASFFEPFYTRKSGSKNKISKEVMKNKRIDVMILELLECIKKTDEIDRLVSLCKVIEILAKLRVVISENSSECSLETKDSRLVYQVIAYINRNFSHDISLDEISKEFYMDKFYISRLFKEQVGITIWNYVIFRRLSTFNDLICANTSIEDAYLRVGFKNYSNFFRLYKKHMNMTPTQYKKMLPHK